MNSRKSNKNINHLSEYWSKLDKRVLEVINEKVIAFKNEIELSLELEGYGNRDVGISIKWLSEEAPIIYLTKKAVKIKKSDYIFYHFKKTKLEKIELIFKKKIDILEKYNEKAKEFGVWANNLFYPKVFKHLEFVVEGISKHEYNLIKINGDLDIILTPIEGSKSKLFIDVKNQLPPYSNKDFNIFFNCLKEFDLNIIPVVIARKIYEDPKNRIKEYNGDYIEMDKVIVPTENKEISKDYNDNIVNMTRVIPENLIPKDIIKNFKN